MIDVSIDITCRTRTEAMEVLREIARDIGIGRFSASCSKEVQEEFRGIVSVATRDAE